MPATIATARKAIEYAAGVGPSDEPRAWPSTWPIRRPTVASATARPVNNCWAVLNRAFAGRIWGGGTSLRASVVYPVIDTERAAPLITVRIAIATTDVLAVSRPQPMAVRLRQIEAASEHATEAVGAIQERGRGLDPDVPHEHEQHERAGLDRAPAEHGLKQQGEQERDRPDHEPDQAATDHRVGERRDLQRPEVNQRRGHPQHVACPGHKHQHRDQAQRGHERPLGVRVGDQVRGPGQRGEPSATEDDAPASSGGGDSAGRPWISLQAHARPTTPSGRLIRKSHRQSA